jgi:hypothetical protein
MLSAIRPPDYFPSIDFWGLVLHADQFVLDLTAPYQKQSYQNRARLRTPDGWQWITVPLVGGQKGVPLANVEIDNSAPWRAKHLRALQYNYRTSPYFEAFEHEFVAFFKTDWKELGPLTVASIRLMGRLLGLPEPETNVDPGVAKTDRPNLVLDSDIRSSDARVVQVSVDAYRQNFPGFVPGLSILDTFFNLGFDTVDLIRDSSHLSP